MTIFVKDSAKTQKITLREVLLVKAEANHVDFIMEERSVLSLMSLKRIKAQLPANRVRVHQSYIVNKHRIHCMDEGMVIIGHAKAFSRIVFTVPEAGCQIPPKLYSPNGVCPSGGER